MLALLGEEELLEHLSALSLGKVVEVDPDLVLEVGMSREVADEGVIFGTVDVRKELQQMQVEFSVRLAGRKFVQHLLKDYSEVIILDFVQIHFREEFLSEVKRFLLDCLIHEMRKESRALRMEMQDLHILLLHSLTL